MLLKIIFLISGFFLFLYFFWSRLKEDYLRNQIFTTGLYVLAGIVLGAYFSEYFLKEWSLWLIIIGSLTGSTVGIFRFRLRFFEIIEATVFGGVVLIAAYFSYQLILHREVIYLVLLIIAILLFFCFSLLDKRYKTFSWYRSRRLGFTGLSIAGVFFLLIAFIAASFSGMISFVGKKDIIVSSIFAFICFVALYNLSRKRL